MSGPLRAHAKGSSPTSAPVFPAAVPGTRLALPMGSRGQFVLLVLVAVLTVPTRADAASLKLVHDSFSTVYRSPFGAVPAGSKVTLQLRVTGGHAKAVTLRVTVGSGKTKNVHMLRRGTFWRATLKMPSSPAVVNYDFRVRDRLR